MSAEASRRRARGLNRLWGTHARKCDFNGCRCRGAFQRQGHRRRVGDRRLCRRRCDVHGGDDGRRRCGDGGRARQAVEDRQVFSIRLRLVGLAVELGAPDCGCVGAAEECDERGTIGGGRRRQRRFEDPDGPAGVFSRESAFDVRNRGGKVGRRDGGRSEPEPECGREGRGRWPLHDDPCPARGRPISRDGLMEPGKNRRRLGVWLSRSGEWNGRPRP